MLWDVVIAQITDAVAGPISEIGPLKSIDLSDVNMTRTGLLVMLQPMTNLKELKLIGCSLISNEVVATVKEIYGQLHIAWLPHTISP